MKNKIDDVVTKSNLRSAAGGRSYSRGEEYFLDGAVHHLYCDGKQLTADVHGTHVYHARITNDDGFLTGDCSCPFGQDGNFCKHLVALGLEYLDMQENPSTKKSKSTFSWKDFLKNCDKEELIKIVLEMSPNNTDVIERYQMANLPSSGNKKLQELKSKVDELYRLADDIEEYYNDRWDYYEEDDSGTEFKEESELLLKVMEGIADQKDFKLLWEITTYAIGKFMGSPNAELNSVQEFAYGLANLFSEVVKAQIKSNNEIFKVFKEWEKQGKNFGYDYLSSIFRDFPVEIRKMWVDDAMKTWRKYPPRELGDFQSGDEERDYIEDQLLIWADEHHDDSLKLEIMEKKMHSFRDVIELAKEYRRQGMDNKVFPLLKKGHEAFDRDREITDMLLEELQKTGKNDEALKMAWTDFTNDCMSDIALNRLEKVATNMKCWKDYYQKVLDFLEKKDKSNFKRTTSYFDYSYNIRPRRVAVLFNHGDQEVAWELAQGADLSEDWWLKLAAWRSKDAPNDAAFVVKDLLNKALRPTGEDAYCHVVSLLKIYRKYLKMAGKESEFTAYCLSIRTEYKRRRLLMDQMDAARL